MVRRVLVQYPNGKLAGIDSGNGPYSAPGYPFEAWDVSHVYIGSEAEAIKAAKVFDLKVVPITMEVKVG